MLSTGVHVVEWFGYEAGVSASSAVEKGVPPGVGSPLLRGWKDMVQVEGDKDDRVSR